MDSRLMIEMMRSGNLNLQPSVEAEMVKLEAQAKEAQETARTRREGIHRYKSYGSFRRKSAQGEKNPILRDGTS